MFVCRRRTSGSSDQIYSQEREQVMWEKSSAEVLECCALKLFHSCSPITPCTSASNCVYASHFNVCVFHSVRKPKCIIYHSAASIRFIPASVKQRHLKAVMWRVLHQLHSYKLIVKLSKLTQCCFLAGKFNLWWTSHR